MGIKTDGEIITDLLDRLKDDKTDDLQRLQVLVDLEYYLHQVIQCFKNGYFNPEISHNGHGISLFEKLYHEKIVCSIDSSFLSWTARISHSNVISDWTTSQICNSTFCNILSSRRNKVRI